MIEITDVGLHFTRSIPYHPFTQTNHRILYKTDGNDTIRSPKLMLDNGVFIAPLSTEQTSTIINTNLAIRYNNTTYYVDNPKCNAFVQMTNRYWGEPGMPEGDYCETTFTIYKSEDNTHGDVSVFHSDQIIKLYLKVGNDIRTFQSTLSAGTSQMNLGHTWIYYIYVTHIYDPSGASYTEYTLQEFWWELISDDFGTYTSDVLSNNRAGYLPTQNNVYNHMVITGNYFQ